MARTQRRLKKAGDVREEIDNLLSRPLNDREWDYLTKMRYVDEIAESSSHRMRQRAVEDAVDAVRLVRELFSSTAEPKIEKSRMLSEQEMKRPTDRSQAISILIAQQAAEDTQVQIFRTEVLGDTHLPFEEVEKWIQQQSQKEGLPTIWWSDIPLPQPKVDELRKLIRGIVPDTPYLSLEIPVDQLKRMVSMHIRLLKYAVPDDNWVRCLPTSIGGILERLRLLGEHLEKRYGWQQAQATTFVLTDRPPMISPLSCTLKRNSRTLLQRIVLEIDPVVSPKQVTEQYTALRKELISVRPRTLSEKHMQLAIFDSTRPKSETWAKKMAEWNKEQQAEWRYKEVSNFSLDCRKARRRLLSL
jgi:hypothetical protein